MELNAEVLYRIALEELAKEKEEKIMFRGLSVELENKIKDLENKLKTISKKEDDK